VQARVRCWEHLQEKSASTDLTDPQNCAVRAVICALHPEPTQDDVAEVIDWFLTITRKIGIAFPDPEPLLRSCFIEKKI
jgi:hypothetical protein